MNKRLFIGIPIPDQTRDALRQIDVSQKGFRPVAETNWHLTLKFIGEVEAQQEAAIRAVLKGIGGRPFLLSVERVGFFPPRGRPTVFWVGVGQGHPALFGLQKRIESALDGVGIAPEKRPYHPHITLARLRNVAPERAKQLGRAYAEFAAPPMQVATFNLYLSQLKPDGVVYSVEQQFELSD